MSTRYLRIKSVLRQLLFGLLTLVALLLISLVLLLTAGPRVSLDPYLARLSAAASKADKRDLSLGAGSAVRLAWHPELSLHQLALTQYKHGSTSAVLQVTHLFGRASLPSLLRGNLRLRALKVDGLRLTLYPKVKAVVAAPPLARPASKERRGTPTPLPTTRMPARTIRDRLAVDELQVTDAALCWLDGRGEIDSLLTIEEGSGAAATGHPIEVTVEGHWHGQPFSLAASGGTLGQLLAKQDDWPVNVEISSSNTFATCEGFLGRAPGSPAQAMTITAHSPSLKEACSILGWSMPSLGPCRVSGTLIRDRQTLRLQDFTGEAGDGRFELQLAGHKHPGGGKLMTVDAKLTGTTLADISVLLGKSIQGVTGHVGRAQLHYEKESSPAADLKPPRKTFSVAATNVALAYGEQYGKPLYLDGLAIAEGPAGLTASMHGQWLGEPFAGQVRSGGLASWKLTNSIPIHVQIEGPASRIVVAGSTQKQGRDLKRHFRLPLEVTATRIGDLSAWLGCSPETDLPLKFGGTLEIGAGQYACRAAVLKLGSNDVSGELVWDAQGETPRVFAQLESRNIDITSLSKVLPARPKKQASPTPPSQEKAQPSAKVMDIPILPARLPVPNTEVGIRASRVAINQHIITNLLLAASFSDGSLRPSELSYEYAGARLAGEIALDMTGDTPHGTLMVSASDVDIGALLAARGMASNLVFKTEQFRLQASARGDTLEEILDWAEMSCSLTNGLFVYCPPGAEWSITTAVTYAEAWGEENDQVEFRATGTINGEPITFELGSEWQLEAGARRQIPMRIELSSSTETLMLEGQTELPFRLDANRLAVDLKGPDLALLSLPAGPTLPSIGPYHLAATLATSPTGYLLTDMVAAAGSSSVGGWARWETARPRPYLQAAIHSGTIQLDDLALKEWTEMSPTNREQMVDTVTPAAATPPESAVPPPKSAEDSVVASLLRDVDAKWSLDIDEVRSGRDYLGSAHIQLELNRGHLVISPFRIELPGGVIDATADYQETGTSESLDLRAGVRNFDYGVLARRLGSTNEFVQGMLDIEMHITGSAPTLDTLLHDANGYLAVAVRPESLDATIFDLWSANLITALVPSLDRKPASELNCAAMAFILKDGVLKDRVIGLDTSRVRVTGHGSVDFKSGALRLELKPKAKKAAFFSLATPVGVKGTVDAPEINISIWEVTKSVGRFVVSIVTVPVKRIFTTPLPPDGTDALLEQMREAVDSIKDDNDPVHSGSTPAGGEGPPWPPHSRRTTDGHCERRCEIDR